MQTGKPKAQLFIIDPQNDFIGTDAGAPLEGKATLPVTGGEGDMQRLAGMVRRVRGKLDDIIVTLDSHRPIDVAHPAMWRDFSVIPDVLRGWYEAVFQRGERSIPPSPSDKAIAAQPASVVQRTTTTATRALVFERLFDQGRVRKVWPCGCALVGAAALTEFWQREFSGKRDAQAGGAR